MDEVWAHIVQQDTEIGNKETEMISSLDTERPNELLEALLTRANEYGTFVTASELEQLCQEYRQLQATITVSIT